MSHTDLQGCFADRQERSWDQVREVKNNPTFNNGGSPSRFVHEATSTYFRHHEALCRGEGIHSAAMTEEIS